MNKDEQKKIIDFFKREERTSEEAIKSNSMENNTEMVKHWQQWKQGIRRLKFGLCDELNIKL